jgi:hypothetical protein
MLGTIRKLEVLSHPRVTIKCFGWGAFFRALFSRRDQTFLSLLSQAGVFQQSQVPTSEFIDRCITLETRAMWIYQSLALRLAQTGPAQEFFSRLAQQENAHARLLELCRVAASRGGWNEQGLQRWRQSLPAAERLLNDAEASLREDLSLVDSFRLVIRMESSQINGLFTSIVEATDPRLPKAFTAFRTAVRDHLEYIRQRIPVLEPSLKSECAQLQAGS